MTENDTEMATGNYRSRPNLFCEISEEYGEGLPDRELVYSYIVQRPDTTPTALFYVVGIGLAFGLTLLFNSFTKKFSKTFSKWRSSKDSQEPVSTLEADRSVEARERPSGGHILKQCEGQESENENEPLTRATPKFMLEVFICCQKGRITKKAATPLLMIYYNVSEAEALEWLS